MAIQTNERGALGFIARQGGQFEPQRVNNALLKLDLAGLGGSNITNFDADTLVLSLASFPIPKVSNTVITAHYLNTEAKFAGRASVEAMSVVYRDYVDMQTADILEQWRAIVFNARQGTVGYARDYKTSGTLELLGPDIDANNALLSGRYRFFALEGVWPSLVDRGDMDMSGDDQVLITTTLEIDMSIPVNSLNEAQ